MKSFDNTFIAFFTSSCFLLCLPWQLMLILVAQSCPTLCNPMDCSPAGSSVHEIFQARILEWVAISFSRVLPNPGIEPGSPVLQTDSLPTELQGVYKICQISNCDFLLDITLNYCRRCTLSIHSLSLLLQ